MTGLANRLARDLDRPVFDKTGIQGFYRIALQFGTEDISAMGQLITILCLGREVPEESKHSLTILHSARIIETNKLQLRIPQQVMPMLVGRTR
jgi:uncharacterized protein (TIGR03435 family)